jgi:hypothetical protein
MPAFHDLSSCASAAYRRSSLEIVQGTNTQPAQVVIIQNAIVVLGAVCFTCMFTVVCGRTDVIAFRTP